jgi:drug/metabolite transporter (DMT)-like permease
MLGEVLALATALLSTGSALLSAKALKEVSPIRCNTIRIFFSGIFIFPIALMAGELNNLSKIDVYGLLIVIVAAIIGFGISEFLLYKSFILIGVSRGFTISYTYPMFAMAIGILFLGEPFVLMYLIGTILMVLSITMVSIGSKGSKKFDAKGVLVSVTSAIAAASGTVIVSIGLRSISVLLANALRFPVLALFLFLFAQPRKPWNLSRRNVILLAVSGILGVGIGGITYLNSIQLIGVIRATPLSASSPVWTSILSSLILKEKVSMRLFLSSVIVVAGIVFLTI